MKSRLTQEQLLRQRLLPQQLRFAAMLEQTDDEMADEIDLELAENPALERVTAAEDDSERRYYAPRSSGADDAAERQPLKEYDETLAEHLRGQLSELPESPERRIADYMIDALDSNGYMTRTLPQIREDITVDAALPFEPTMEQIRAASELLRGLEPAGIGAQDLRDCLLLQLKRLPADKPYLAEALEIVRYWFDLFGNRNFKRLATESGIPEENIAGANKLITSLNPRPGSEFSADPVRAIADAAVVPTFVVETDGQQLTVSMPNSLPELQIEESFKADAPAGDAGEFIRKNRSEAQTFIDLLRRRRETLMKIGRAIVSMQSEFFLNGDDESLLKPMVLRQVADRTGIDLTSISRAIAGKWLATQWGVYPLKSFFSHRGKAAAADGDLSTPAILAAMREIIENEDPSAPLSDEAISAALAARNLKVARRTISKYRNRLGILEARLRKK
ncbi:MAG: RNA polymerase factor sigma-54 [Muribaculaceae bacterium]|nr:RNA polymerase factor sigma-54 [Muribaculaceae bacterium]